MTRASGRAEGRSTARKSNRAAQAARQRCFVLEINQRPVLAFSASSLRSARARVQEAWFVQELESMRSGGRPLLCPDHVRQVRLALPAEIAAVELGRGLDEARGENAKYGFAFLVPIDVPPN
jgi:hypothetical protein